MSKPRYLEYLLHLLTEEELHQLCDARVLAVEGSRDDKIKRIINEPINKVYDQDYLQLLSPSTLQRLCQEVGQPWDEQGQPESLMFHATRIFRDVNWSRYVTLAETVHPSSRTDTHRAWKDIELIGAQVCEDVLSQQSAIDLLVEWTGESETNIVRTLQNSKPPITVRRALAHVWPQYDEGESSPSQERPTATAVASNDSADVYQPKATAMTPDSESKLEQGVTKATHTSEEPNRSEFSMDAFWFLDDWMHEFYVWLRAKRTVHKHPRQGRREILLQYPGLHEEHYTLVVHFDGVTPIFPDQLREKLQQSSVFEGKQITSFAVLAHAFQPESLAVLQENRAWFRNTALLEVKPHTYKVLHQEKQLRSFSLLRQFLDMHKQHQTLRAHLPNLEEPDATLFVSSLHDAPTNKGFVPFQSVVVKRTTSESSGLFAMPGSPESTYDTLLAEHVIHERYVFLLFLGESEVGKTFLVHDQHAHRDCLLKVIRPALAQQTAWKSQCLQQLEQYCKVSTHRNLASYYECGTDTRQGLTYFTMEYVPGDTLETLLQQSQQIPPIPLQQSLSILQSVAHTLTHIHNRGYVHRGVTPAHIVMMALDDYKLLDFGILIEDSASSLRLYDTVSQSKGALLPAGIDPKTPEYDLYTFAALTYRLLTGHTPDPEHLHSPSHFYPAYPAALDTLLAQALGQDAVLRPSSAVMWIRQIRQILLPLLPAIASEKPSVLEGRIHPSSAGASAKTSHISQRPGSRSLLGEIWLNFYSTFFRYSLTKQAVEQRKQRGRFAFLVLGLLLASAAIYWWWLVP